MRRQWIFGCVVACLVGLRLFALEETYPLVSREYTVGMGAATSGDQVRTIVSREITVGVGEEN